MLEDPPDRPINKDCPKETVGLLWLKVIGEVLTVLAVALMIPQVLISDEQTVIAAEPLVLSVLIFTILLVVVLMLA